MLSTNEALALPLLLPLQQRNAFFDAWFYDVMSLTEAERLNLNPFANKEGTLVVVPPSDSNRPIRHYNSIVELMAGERGEIKALALAGVGSSVLGTAALARNVADARDTDCIGVVSGYGAADLISEAIGGWFFYGAADAAKHTMKSIIEFPRRLADDHSRTFGNPTRSQPIHHPLRSRVGGSDTSSIIALISNLPSIDLVVGHSKVLSF